MTNIYTPMQTLAITGYITALADDGYKIMIKRAIVGPSDDRPFKVILFDADGAEVFYISGNCLPEVLKQVYQESREKVTA